jgi:hypothetical protein
MNDDLFTAIETFLAERRDRGSYTYYFGGCPVCLASGRDLLYDADLCEWFVCYRCGVRWCFGLGNFPSWQEMTADELAWQHHRLAQLRQVEPYYPPAVR